MSATDELPVVVEEYPGERQDVIHLEDLRLQAVMFSNECTYLRSLDGELVGSRLVIVRVQCV